MLQYLFEQGQVVASRYWNADEISEATGLPIKDIQYHLNILEQDGYVTVLPTMGEHYAASIEPAGVRWVREGVEVSRGGNMNIGALIHQMSGGNVQGVGSAVDSEVSQVVNDPGELRAALDELIEKLRDAVRAELQDRDLDDYTRALDDLKAELETRKDPGRLKAPAAHAGIIRRCRGLNWANGAPVAACRDGYGAGTWVRHSVMGKK